MCAATVLTLAGTGAVAQSGQSESREAFTLRCVEEIAARWPNSENWAGDACRVKWEWAGTAGPMAEAILGLAGTAGGASLSRDAMEAALPQVAWSSPGDGRLGDLMVTVLDGGALSFHWEEMGSEGRYNLIDALRIRGVRLTTLGCPVYPGASMGAEKVMLAQAEGVPDFTVTVYSRPAPAGFTPGVYTVDARFGAVAPDRAALEAGAYPGGGGRAFAVDVQGWVEDCPDPD
jgi:hypothetical protein